MFFAERLYPALKKPMPTAPVSVGAGVLLLNAMFIVGKPLFVLGGFFGLLGLIFVLMNAMLLSAGVLLGLGAVATRRMGTVKHVA